MAFAMGNGRRVRFWKDKWCGGDLLSTSFPSLYAITSSKEVWYPSADGGVWAPCFFRQLNDWEVVPVECFFQRLQGRRVCRDDKVGSGVGLVGICLAHVKASKVILSEGGLSSLANMKLNLELNQLNNRMDDPGTTNQDPNLVKCIFLPWESAEESELQNFMPDIILGADVIYNPLCLPHLIRVLATLLNQTRSSSPLQQDNCVEFSPDSRCIMDARAEGADIHNHDHGSRSTTNADGRGKNSVPVAYIASVIRNIETFNYFLALAEEANLDVKDLTEQYFDGNQRTVHVPLSFEARDLFLYQLIGLCINEWKLSRYLCK
uniref:Uncharacterized protein n=1 Tax=Vitis vinifera TaxID=29760 RepID=A5BCM0_VITVI|nr:hypothetical protein VITISV_035932 [Vitis vinifera]